MQGEKTVCATSIEEAITQWSQKKRNTSKSKRQLTPENLTHCDQEGKSGKIEVTTRTASIVRVAHTAQASTAKSSTSLQRTRAHPVTTQNEANAKRAS